MPEPVADEGLTGREQLLLALIAVLTVAAGILHYAGAPGVTAFAAATAALAGMAWIVSFATEQVGERFGPAVTGVLQSTLGNLPEFFVVIFALGAGEVVVAKFSLIGSIFANALFVLGLVIVVGSRASPDGIMRFGKRLPRDTATLMLLSVFIIALMGLSLSSGDKASHHTQAISTIGAIVLLLVYMAWVIPYVRGDHRGEPILPPRLPLSVSITLLAIAGTAAAFVSDWFIAELNPAIDALGVSKEFAGLVIVAIAGNAVENFTGLVLAQGPGRSRDLGGQELGRPDRGLPVPRARARVVAVRDATDVRARAAVHRRAGADGAHRMAGHRRRRGHSLRGLGARGDLRDPRRIHAVRVGAWRREQHGQGQRRSRAAVRPALMRCG